MIVAGVKERPAFPRGTGPNSGGTVSHPLTPIITTTKNYDNQERVIQDKAREACFRGLGCLCSWGRQGQEWGHGARRHG